jgi:ketosteroid isomerase-like protein
VSSENLLVARAMMDAFNRRDADAFLALLRPDVEWDDTAGFPGLQGVYRGPEGAREWWERFLEAWESFHADVEKITEGSDGQVVMEVLGTARGRASGVETELRAWFVLWFRDHEIARRQLHWSREEALEAAGLPTG